MTIVSAAASAAVRSGEERITKSGIEALRYVPVSKRRRASVRDDLTDKDTATAHRCGMILAAGGHDELIARFADFLDKHQTRPGSMRSTLPCAGLAKVLTAYMRVAGDRTTSKSHRDLGVPQPQ